MGLNKIFGFKKLRNRSHIEFNSISTDYYGFIFG